MPSPSPAAEAYFSALCNRASLKACSGPKGGFLFSSLCQRLTCGPQSKRKMYKVNLSRHLSWDDLLGHVKVSLELLPDQSLTVHTGRLWHPCWTMDPSRLSDPSSHRGDTRTVSPDATMPLLVLREQPSSPAVPHALCVTPDVLGVLQPPLSRAPTELRKAGSIHRNAFKFRDF